MTIWELFLAILVLFVAIGLIAGVFYIWFYIWKKVTEKGGKIG